MSLPIEELIPRLRRAIGDTNEENYDYSDTLLEEYIEDAVFNLLVRFQHDYDVEDGLIEPEPSELEKTMFIIQAKLDLINRQPRFSFSSGTLSVTHRGDDRKELEAKLKKAVRKAKTAKGIGTSLTEFDNFAKRIENRIYINTIP